MNFKKLTEALNQLTEAPPVQAAPQAQPSQTPAQPQTQAQPAPQGQQLPPKVSTEATPKDIWGSISAYVQYVNKNNIEQAKESFPALDDDTLFDAIWAYVENMGGFTVRATAEKKVYSIRDAIRKKYKIYG